MHNVFYASGFLYNLASQQILLQQHNDSAPLWSLFGQKGQNNENPLQVFRDVISKQLQIELPLKKIYPVYNYYHEELRKNHFTYYAEINQKEINAFTNGDHTIEWFSFKQITKLPLTIQTKHDIVVAERVILAKVRNDEAKLLPAIETPQTT